MESTNTSFIYYERFDLLHEAIHDTMREHEDEQYPGRAREWYLGIFVERSSSNWPMEFASADHSWLAEPPIRNDLNDR